MSDKEVTKAEHTRPITLDTAKASVKPDTLKEVDYNLQHGLDKADHEREMRRQQREEGQLKLREIEHRHADQVANRDMRQKYAKWVYYYLVGYSVCVGLLVFGSAATRYPFWIPDQVLQILVGSTAVSSIGLVLAVTHGLFSKKCKL